MAFDPEQGRAALAEYAKDCGVVGAPSPREQEALFAAVMLVFAREQEPSPENVRRAFREYLAIDFTARPQD